jgi:hypothetical protein
VLSLGEGLVVERVEHAATTLTVFVASPALAARCPLCQEPISPPPQPLPTGGRRSTVRWAPRPLVREGAQIPLPDDHRSA